MIAKDKKQAIIAEIQLLQLRLGQESVYQFCTVDDAGIP